MTTSEVLRRWVTPVTASQIEFCTVSQTLSPSLPQKLLKIEIIEPDLSPELLRSYFSFKDPLYYQTVEATFYPCEAPEEADEDPLLLEELGPFQIVSNSRLLEQIRGKYPYLDEYFGEIIHYRIVGGSSVIDILCSSPACMETGKPVPRAILYGDDSYQPDFWRPSLPRRFILRIKKTLLYFVLWGFCIPFLRLLALIERLQFQTLDRAHSAMLLDVSEEIGIQELPRKLKSWIKTRHQELEQGAWTLIGSTQKLTRKVGGSDTYTAIWKSKESTILLECSYIRSSRTIWLGALPYWFFPKGDIIWSLESKFLDDSFLITINAASLKDDKPPSIQFRVIDSQSSIQTQLSLHESAALETARAKQTTLVHFLGKGLADYYDKEKLQSAILAKHWKEKNAELYKNSLLRRNQNPLPPGSEEAVRTGVRDFRLHLGYPDALNFLGTANANILNGIIEETLLSNKREEQLSALIFLSEAARFSDYAEALRIGFFSSNRRDLIRNLMGVSDREICWNALRAYYELFNADAANDLASTLQILVANNPLEIPTALDLLHRADATRGLDEAEKLASDEDFFVRWAIVDFAKTLPESLAWRTRTLKHATRDPHPCVRREAISSCHEGNFYNAAQLNESRFKYVDFSMLQNSFYNSMFSQNRVSYTREELVIFLNHDVPRLIQERLELHKNQEK